MKNKELGNSISEIYHLPMKMINHPLEWWYLNLSKINEELKTIYDMSYQTYHSNDKSDLKCLKLVANKLKMMKILQNY